MSTQNRVRLRVPEKFSAGRRLPDNPDISLGQLPSDPELATSQAEQDSSTEPATTQTDAEASAAKFARANLVDPPITADDDPGANEEIANGDAIAMPAKLQPTRTPMKTALEQAIVRCTALGYKTDPIVTEKWTKRAAPILKESLYFLAEYEAASDAEQQAVRMLLKAKSGVSRKPNIDNLPVIAVCMCVWCTVEKRTEKQRNEWCRFATVVKVAAKASIKPDAAADWLEGKTLTSILTEWSKQKKSDGKKSRKPAVPKALKDYTHLAEALAWNSKFRDLAKDELAKADAAVAEAMEQAASCSSGETNASAPVEEVAANA